MKRKSSCALLAALILASLSGVVASARAAPPTKGGKAVAHMSAKARINTDAQWSADPEKGWVRAEENHQTQIEQQTKSRNNRGNRRDKGPKKHIERNLERNSRK